jgi:putative transposase
MPRVARIDIPGLLHHVIVRGIERRDIFMDDADRHSFVERLSSLLEKTEMRCYAWALMSNHVHLLLRPTRGKLSTFMRRLLTGHAVSFNLRHERSGHLFQNRYKSIVCQEDEYLLQLIRYIHLNPLRVNMVADMKGLERYRWSGHRVLMGKQELPGQDVDNVLALFGKSKAEARRRYREFIADGIAEGKRDDLVGRAEKSTVAADSRILGASEFVEDIRLREDGGWQLGERRTIAEIVDAVAGELGIPVRAITAGSRMKTAVNARSAICRIALEEGHSAAEVGRQLGMSRYGVGVAGRRVNDAIPTCDNSAC